MTDHTQSATLTQAVSNESADGSLPSKEACGQHASEPGITICFKNETIIINQDNISQVDDNSIIAKCQANDGPIEVDVSGLHTFDQADRIRLLLLIKDINPSRLVVNGQHAEDLLDATLSLMTAELPPTSLDRLKRVAIEIIAVMLPDASSVSTGCHRLQQKYKDMKIKGIKIKDLENEVKGIKQKIDIVVRQQEIQQLIRAKDCIPDAPVSEDLHMPRGWSWSNGVFQKPYGKISGTLHAPVFPTAISVDPSGRQAVLLEYKCHGRWHKKWVDRMDIADKNRCIQLSNMGIDVTSNNASLMVEYLSDFIKANENVLPNIHTVSRMGFFQADNSNVFVLGYFIITADSIYDSRISAPQSSSGMQPTVMFRSDNDGLMQLASAYCQKGSFHLWLEAVLSIMIYPRMRFLLMASFASPVLEIVKSSNFNISIAGPTSCGKTTAMTVCASPWGCCEVSNADSQISNWDTSNTYRERHRLFADNLPVFFDETKLAKGYEYEVSKTMYSAASGRSRGRGTVTSVAQMEVARNITFITGEQPATSFSEDGGAYARTLEMWDSPFGVTSPETGNLVRHVSSALVSNYGHAGPVFVQYLLKHKDQWEVWRQRFSEFENKYSERAGSNVIARRLASYMATIALTSELVHQALSLPGEWSDPIDPVWDELTRATEEANHAKKSLLVAHQHYVNNPTKFYRPSTYDFYYAKSYIGRIEPLSSAPSSISGSSNAFDFEWLGYSPDYLENLLREHGYNYESIIKQWKAAGWLVTDNEQGTTRNQKKTTISGNQTRVIAISAAAIEAALN